MDAFDPTAFEQDIGVEGADEQDDQDQSPTMTGRPRQQPFRQALVLCIDCHSVRDLFATPNSKDAITWETLVSALTKLARAHIVQSGSDKVGLVLYGTQNTHNEYRMEHLYEILSLDFLSVQAIKKLMELSLTSFADFTAKYGSLADVRAANKKQKSSICPVSSVFRYALRAFRIYAPPFKFTRKLLFFTHRSDPCVGLPHDRVVSTQLGLDLIGNGVTIDLFPLNLKIDNPFDVDLYYQPLLTRSARIRLGNVLEEPNEALQSEDTLVGTQTTSSLLSELEAELKRRAAPNRVLQKTLLRIAPGLCVAVAVFLVIGEAKKPNPVLLRAEDHKPLYSETKWIDSGTGELLARDELKRFYAFQGLRVNFTDEEILQMKAIQSRPHYEAFDTDEEETGVRMTLMGFKPLRLLDRTRHALRMQVYFLFPLEAEVAGSSLAFHAMVKSMWNLKRIAVICWQFRATSAPRLYAAVPQLDETADGQSTAGLFMLALPYAEEIRHLSLDAQVSDDEIRQAELEVVETIVTVLEKLDLGDHGVDPTNLRNPALARHFAGLEALALGQSDLSEVVDDTLPDQALFQGVKTELQKLSEVFAISRGTKRAVGGTKTASAGLSMMDLEQVRGLVATNRLGSMTVVQIKAVLTGLGLQVSTIVGEGKLPTQRFRARRQRPLFMGIASGQGGMYEPANQGGRACQCTLTPVNTPGAPIFLQQRRPESILAPSFPIDQRPISYFFQSIPAPGITWPPAPWS